jgi:hypothetical protein
MQINLSVVAIKIPERLVTLQKINIHTIDSSSFLRNLEFNIFLNFVKIILFLYIANRKDKTVQAYLVLTHNSCAQIKL